MILSSDANLINYVRRAAPYGCPFLRQRRATGQGSLTAPFGFLGSNLSVIASDERSNPARRNFEGAVERLRLNTGHQLACFAFARNDGDVVRQAHHSTRAFSAAYHEG